jgi:hypothetical protein
MKDIELWKDDHNCGLMAGGLEWKDGFSAAKSRVSTKFCIPIIEGGKARAMRLLVPGDAPARKSKKNGAAAGADSHTPLDKRLELARKVVGFYRQCSAVAHLEKKCASANAANKAAGEALSKASNAAEEAERVFLKVEWDVSNKELLTIPDQIKAYSKNKLLHKEVCNRIRAGDLKFKNEHQAFLAELASTKAVLASLVSLAKVRLSSPASSCAATAARPPLRPTLSPPVAFPAGNG